ncbi:MAG TPA: flagellar hook-basal body complex protein FliE [Candidatus Sulfotelmatobacter sp.]|nr:flagellar hook-basal body complex protein FliE [Candidatus Sulfotelmatobacter sp.]
MTPPISAITPTDGGMSVTGMATPEATPLPSTRIEMPEELGEPLSTASVQPASGSFASMLGQMVSDVNAQQATSAQAVSALQSGQNVPLHQAVIAMEEANVSFQLMVEVRNRLMDAYQEIMRMQI